MGEDAGLKTATDGKCRLPEREAEKEGTKENRLARVREARF